MVRYFRVPGPGRYVVEYDLGGEVVRRVLKSININGNHYIRLDIPRSKKAPNFLRIARLKPL